ncbi:MAG: methyltransferase family protein [Myxococcota bacterium]
MSFVRKRLRPRLLLVYLLAFSVIYLAEPTPTRLVLGSLLVTLGEALRIWATGHLSKNEELTVTGPYRYLRHPLYLGTLLIGSGFAVMGLGPVTFWILAIFVVGFVAYYLPYKDRIESARLESLYGEPFRRYRTAVPRIVPRLRPYTPLADELREADAWRRDRFAENHELGTGLVVLAGVLAMLLRWGLL